MCNLHCRVLHLNRTALSQSESSNFFMYIIKSVIMRVITKSDDRVAGVRFVYHEYDYRLYYIHFEITGYPCNVIGSPRACLSHINIHEKITRF